MSDFLICMMPIISVLFLAILINVIRDDNRTLRDNLWYVYADEYFDFCLSYFAKIIRNCKKYRKNT